MTLHLVTGRSGDPHVTSMDAGRFNALTIGEGRYIVNGCDAAVVDSNTIGIANGDMLIDGRHVSVEGTGETVTIENGQSGYNRIDLICLHYERGEGGIETVTFRAIKGTPTASTPSAPDAVGSILNGDIAADIALYSVTINGTAVGAPKLLIESQLPPYYSLGLGEEIPSGADLNDYTTPGNYRVPTNAIAATVSNLPQSEVDWNYPGVLRVYFPYVDTNDPSGWGAVYQKYEDSRGREWWRCWQQHDNYWFPWQCQGGEDSIIAEDVTDVWRWRKYANGVAEAWCFVSETISSASQQGSMYLSNAIPRSFPFNFKSVPAYVVTGSLDYSASGIAYNYANTTTMSFRVWNEGASFANQPYRYSIHLIGLWK